MGILTHRFGVGEGTFVDPVQLHETMGRCGWLTRGDLVWEV